jgi:hypothetical protein
VALFGKLNHWYVLWTSSAALGLVVTFVGRRYALAIANLSLLLLNLYVGFRVDLVVAALTVFAIHLGQRGPQRLYTQWKVCTGVVLLALGLFTYKYVLGAIALQDAGLVAEQIRNPEVLRLIFLYSEPFIIQGTLNEVLRQDFTTEISHFVNCLYLLVPFAQALGAEFVSFNDIFQPQLFSSVTEYGLASNIWAEMMSSGGWPLLILFLAGYCILLCVGSTVFRRATVETTSIAYLVLVYWAFYVHRNDLLYQLTLSRRTFLLGIAVAAASVMFILATSRTVSAARNQRT